MSIHELALAVEKSFADLGIHVSSEETANEVAVVLHIPRHLQAAVSGVDCIAQRESIPSDAVGALVGAKHQFRKKLVKAGKKLAHSKVFKKLASLALDAAPGGKQLKATIKATKALKHAVKKSKGKHPAAKSQAHADAAEAHAELNQDLASTADAVEESPESEDAASVRAVDMSQLARADAPAEDDSAEDDTYADDSAEDDSTNDDTSSDYEPE